MIGLDTNVLARYYIEDDSDVEAQKQRIKNSFFTFADTFTYSIVTLKLRTSNGIPK
jgi:predicted nucleic-acid-binding protein